MCRMKACLGGRAEPVLVAPPVVGGDLPGDLGLPTSTLWTPGGEVGNLGRREPRSPWCARLGWSVLEAPGVMVLPTLPHVPSPGGPSGEACGGAGRSPPPGQPQPESQGGGSPQASMVGAEPGALQGLCWRTGWQRLYMTGVSLANLVYVVDGAGLGRPVHRPEVRRVDGGLLAQAT